MFKAKGEGELFIFTHILLRKDDVRFLFIHLRWIQFHRGTLPRRCLP